MPPTPSTSKSAIAKRKALGDPDSEIEVITEPKSASRKNASTKKATSINGSAKKAAPSKSKGKGKAKSNQSDEDDEDNEDDYNDEVEDVKPKKKVATATNASKKADGNPPKKKAKLEEEEEGEEEEEKQRMNEKLGTEFGVSVWKKGEAKTGPSAPGSKEIPEGEPNCLAGLTFVFTGELDSLDRQEAQNLAKKYGARVTGAPSSKTSYVVLGSGAGAKKLEKIKEMRIKTLDEDSFLDLIRNRSAGDVDEKTKKKQAEEEKKIKQAAKAMGPKVEPPERKAQLWTVKYAPSTTKEICGNKGLVEKLQKWLEDWPKSLKSGFKKPGKEGMNVFRAILISGPPGIGKTTAAHLVAKLAGYSVIELNASDTRSKKLLELGFKSAIDNTSLDGFVGIGSAKMFPDQPGAGEKALLIMDEVDGMSGGDRGGVGALNMLIKKSKIPIIAIANDASLPKMKPLQNTCYRVAFRRLVPITSGGFHTANIRMYRPSAAELRSRLMMIAYREGIKIEGAVIDQLVAGAQSDIRQIINMMSTYALSAKSSLDFETGRELAAASEKNTVQTPFTLIEKLFGPYMFSKTSRATLNDKLDLYFQDFGAMPLFVQENYSKFKFSRVSNLQGRELAMKSIELVQKASDSISEGDLMDSLIHSSEQQWSLLPAHGVASTIRPAYFCYGAGNYGQGAGGFSSSGSSRAFPAWFGKNSSATRLRNALGDVQIRMRLKVSGDRKEIRQSYLPLLAQKLAKPLEERAQEGIEAVMEIMDEYFLTKDEFDTIMELGLDDLNGEVLMKSVNTQTKSAFTRTFNKQHHPIPFHKASDLGTVPKKMAKGDRPDIEDIIELDEDVPEEEEEAKESDNDEDVSKDKLLKNKAKKPAAKKGDGKPAKGSSKASKKT